MRLLLWCCLLWPTLATADATPRRYAIIIGHNATGDGSRAPLRFADDDAARFFELLGPISAQAHLLTRFDADSQGPFAHLVATARPPTHQRLAEAVAAVRAAVKADRAAGRRSILYFVYAGHGDVDDGHGFVWLADGRFTRADLRALLAQGPRADRVHVIVDACKSYYLVAGRGPGGRRAPHPHPFATPARTADVGYVLSTSSDAESHEWAALRAGVFSHEVRSALLGAADMNGDGVDYAELSAFVATANEGIDQPGYRPRVYIRPPTDDRRTIITPPPTGPRLRIAPAAAGRLTIWDPRGLRHLDAHKSSGASLVLALRAGRHRARWRGQTVIFEAGATPVELAGLTPTDTTIAARGADHRVFERLFARPHGPEVVRGFRLASAALTNTAPAVAEPPTPRWLAPVLLGSAVLAAGAGAGLHLGAEGAYADADAGPQTGVRAAEARGNRLAAGAVGAYALATGALFAAAWVWLAD